MSTNPWNGIEPRLDEVLDDPIVRALMRRDGLSEAQVRAMVRTGEPASPPAHGPGSLPAFVSTSSF